MVNIPLQLQEDSNGLSNLIVTADDLTNDFSFTASFSDYLQGSSTLPILLEQRLSAATTNFQQLRTFLIFQRYCSIMSIGDQITFSAVINNAQETISYTVTADDIGADAADSRDQSLQILLQI